MGKVVLPAGFHFHILIVNYLQPLEGRSVASEKGLEKGKLWKLVANKIEVCVISSYVQVLHCQVSVAYVS